MEFWGAEVKSGEPLTVQPGDGMVLHLSQASLGELKKDKSVSVCLSVNVDGNKLVLGTLNSEKVPQQQFDLVFDRDFELSHNLKSGSVYFFGYKATNPFEEEDDDDDEDESDEDIPHTLANNGKPEANVMEAGKSNAGKDSALGKQRVKIVEPSKDERSEDKMSEDEDDSDMGEGEDEDDETEEETPKKAEPTKKRNADSATKTPVTDKKAKLTTPQKTDGKKGGGHVATPHPSKQAGKTTANKNQQTPKSAGSHHCKSCNRGFGSESALESHSKAKHSAGK